MKGNFKEFVRNKKVALTALATSATTALMSLPVLAVGESSTSFDASEVLSTGLNGASSEFMKYVAIIVPIAIGIMVAPFALRKGIALFKSLASK